MIRIRGARQNNLKNIDLDLPAGEMIVVTGVSGSGKSSLVFDTLYAEGQRRYVETFSAYARQFLDRMDKPQVDRIEGVPPAIAIDQTNPVRTSRSTVGTMTELTDHFKLMFARLAELRCKSCGQPVKRQTAQGISMLILAGVPESRVEISFPIHAPESLPDEQIQAWLSAQGFTKIQSRSQDTLYVIQDRLVLRADTARDRINDSVEAALRHGHGRCRVLIGTQQHDFTSSLSCGSCKVQYNEPRPALFSFNSPIGACDTCRGFGRVIGIDPGLVIPDEQKSLSQGAVKPWQTNAYHDCQKELVKHAQKRGVPIDTPFVKLSAKHKAWVFEGDDDWSGDWNRQWYGVNRFFEYLESKAYKMHVRVLLSRYRSYTECHSCKGARLKPEALLWTMHGKTIHDVMLLPIADALSWVRTASTQEKQAPSARGGAEQAASDVVTKEILSRLQFLSDVGLGYLTLDRQSRTLSGGEVQRINLTTALGTSLVNTLFVLDEPSIGLHPRDLHRIIKVMHQLRDAGNTLVVVEHDPLVMQAADRIIDIGPGPGEHGGSILFNGTYPKLLAAKTLTAKYLNGELNVSPPAAAVSPHGSRQLVITGVRANNLRAIDVSIPLGQLVCVTGVSGSGKSTLVQDVLYPAMCKAKGKPTEAPGAFDRLTGADLIHDVVLVDQSPIGKTTRSNPVVYVGAFDAIRQRFAELPQAKQRNYTPGTFSFNAGDGRCPSCGGNGFEHVEMQFLSDVYLRCPDCDGKRFRKEILEIELNGKSIADVLELTISQALEFFSGDEEIALRLQPLVDVGLSYLKCGQPVPTLSGGEAQRLKIAGHLAEAANKAIKGALLIFDEPTTGLHFDDIAKLLKALMALKAAGHSLLIVEHNLDVISCADWIIDLGPEAGAEGGQIVAAGTVAQIIDCPHSHTGKALADALKGASAVLSAQEPAPRRHQGTQAIEIHGAREHNLKNVHVNIPREKMTVITGVSGSGKSTLAFDILFAEGQRRYLESLNAYARQFVQPATRPDIDAVFGIPPTVAIEQRTSRGGRKSTVGTLTEIHHFLRLLFVKIGIQHCPDCNTAIKPQSLESILATLITRHRGQHIGLLAPLVINRKGIYQDLAKWAASKGHSHLRVDGQFVPTAAFPKLDRFKEHTIELPIGDIHVQPSHESQIKTLLQETLNFGQGVVHVMAPLQGPKPSITVLSTRRACPSCGTGFSELDPRLFSYNSKHGWCDECFGTGVQIAEFDSEQTGEEEVWQDGSTNGEDITCSACNGARLNQTALAVRVADRNIAALSAEPVCELPPWMRELTRHLGDRDLAIAKDLISEINSRLAFLTEVGLGYLALDRAAPTLSGGEAQRIRLAAQLGSNLQGVCYILDEPTIGLHPRDNQALLRLLTELKNKGNTLVVVEHDEDTIRLADHLIDIGPGAGARGGALIAQGSQRDLETSAESITGRYLREPLRHSGKSLRGTPKEFISIHKAQLHNLQSANAEIPLHRLTVVTGVSGSGKSSLARDVLLANLTAALRSDRPSGPRAAPAAASSKRSSVSRPTGARAKSGLLWTGCASISGWESIDRVLEVDQTPIGKTPRSTPATYIGFWDTIRKLLTESEEARMRGWKANRFSFNTGDGRCSLCEGQGWQKVEMNFLPDVRVLCDGCGGTRFNAETRSVLWRGANVADILAMNVDAAVSFFENHPSVQRPLKLLQDVGLGYLTLGQPSPTLSGGEAQRIKLVTELVKASGNTGKTSMHTLYVLDEPTVGLHMADIEKLIHVLHRLVDAGNTVVVIEHQLDIWAQADWIIDLGPEGGAGGGKIVGQGSPAQIAKLKTHTGRALGAFLKERSA
ncbi:MAG: excinuclease ABC subunit A [Burkholderiaceae bacterium]|nr:excinuclease ABC subunit A [Burkholderiaceae bacterium]